MCTLTFTVPVQLYNLLADNWRESLDYAVVYTWPRHIEKMPNGKIDDGRSSKAGHSSMHIKRSCIQNPEYISLWPSNRDRIVSKKDCVGSLEADIALQNGRNPSTVFLAGNNDGRPGLDIPAMWKFWQSYRKNTKYWSLLSIIGDNCATCVHEILKKGGGNSLISGGYNLGVLTPLSAYGYASILQEYIIRKRRKYEEQKGKISVA